MLEAGFGEVSQKSKGALSHLRHWVLHTLVEEGQDVGANYQSFNIAAQPLCHAWSGSK